MACSASSEPLVLELSARQDRYYVEEPVVLTATFVNNGTAPVSAHFCAHPVCELGTLWYRKIPYPFRPYQRPIRTATVEGRTHRVFVEVLLMHRPLDGGASTSDGMEVTIDGADSQAVLGSPGRYEFKLEYEERAGTRAIRLTSPIVRVQAVPAPASERGALAAYRPLRTFVHHPWLAPEQLGAAVDFLAEHGESLYAPHVRSSTLALLRSKINSATASQDDRDLYLRLTGGKR